MKKNVAKICLVIIFLFQFSAFTLIKPTPIDAGSLEDVVATLGNSRLSFFARTDEALSSGVSLIPIENSGNADNNTNNLFPQDTVEIGTNTNLTVANVPTMPNGTVFIIDQPLSSGVADETPVYSIQTTSLVVSFTLQNDIPANGYIYITIPANTSNPNDGYPDTAASTDNNGFDANSITASDWTVSGGTGCTWGTKTWTASSGGGTPHSLKVVTTTTCTGGTITATLDGSPGLVNPAPITSNHTQGTADVYTINVATYTSTDTLIDSGKTKVAPIEGVLVTARIEETINFKVEGVTSGTSTCGKTTSVTTYPYLIPFGSLSAPNIATASQKLTVSTNASSYLVTLEENDQLSIDGLGVTTIADAICDNETCTHNTSAEWATGYNPAIGNFGYSLENITSHNNAAFSYNDSGRFFSARQIAENGVDFTPPSSSPPTIMSASSPVHESQIYVCYVLAFQAIQPAGYYLNKLRYTATPTFN